MALPDGVNSELLDENCLLREALEELILEQTLFQKDGHKSNNNAIHSHLAEKNREIENLQLQLKDCVAKHEATTKAREIEHIAFVNVLKNENRSLVEDNAKIKNQFKELESKCKTWRSEEKQSKERLESHNVELNYIINDQKEKLDKAKAESHTYHQKVGQLRHENENLLLENSKLKEENKRLFYLKRDLTQNLSQITTELQSVLECKAALEQESHQKESENKLFKAEVESLKAQKTALLNEKMGIENEKRRVDKEVISLKESLGAKNLTVAHSGECLPLQNEVNALRQENESLNVEKNMLCSRLQSYERVQMSREIVAYSPSSSDCDSGCADTSSVTLTPPISELKYKDLQRANDVVVAENKTLKRKVSFLEGRLDEWKRNHKQKLDLLTDAKRRAEAKLTERELELEQLKEEYSYGISAAANAVKQERQCYELQLKQYKLKLEEKR